MDDVERRVRQWRDANASPTGRGPGSMAIADDQVHRWWDVQTLLEVIDALRVTPDRAALVWELFDSWEEDEQIVEREYAVGQAEHASAEAERVSMRERIEAAFGPRTADITATEGAEHG